MGRPPPTGLKAMEWRSTSTCALGNLMVNRRVNPATALDKTGHLYPVICCSMHKN